MFAKNRKCISAALCLLGFSSSLAIAWNGDEIDFPGQGNGWSLAANSAKFTGPDGGTEWFRYTLTMPTSYANYAFKMTTGNTYDNSYGENMIFAKDSLDILQYGGTGVLDAKLGQVTAGKRYVFTAKDPGLTDTYISVQELDNDPVTISSTSRNATSGLISVTLSAAPSPQEKVYIRYSDDSFGHWYITAANISGTTATAKIPELKDGRSYQWYAFTSTATPDKFHNGFAVDALTLAWDNNGGSNFSFSTPDRITNFSVNGTSGPYQTTKFYIDEIANDTEAVNVVVALNGGPAPLAVEVVTNLNRRTYADLDGNSDGVEDGIVLPPRDLVGQNDLHYFKAFPMTLTGGNYEANLTAEKTGAYRLTVRYRMSASDPWIYFRGRPLPNYGGEDHAIVVSPKKTLEMTLYEINPLTVEATADSEAGRSTFVDLLGVSDGDTDGSDPVNLEYFNDLQVNCLWFQPIHPTGGEGVENDPGTGSSYLPGSPYATKNFFAVNPFLGTANTETSAMTEFQTFIDKADDHSGTAGTINVMLDFVANHSAWDAIFGQGGVDLGYGTATERIPVNWFSRKDHYGLPARWHNNPSDTDIGTAPDRHDFGKWADVAELYYGRYSAQVQLQDGSQINQYKNEEDLIDVGSLSPEVINLWRYFGYYPEYWLAQSGHSLANSVASNPAVRLAEDDTGIDALRCDFGQGLPNPLWEYIVNRTRSKKWNFVFMAETLDGAEPGYRSNRVFDILNESMVFQFTQAQVNDEGTIQSQLESRRSTYSDGAILLNTTSHDEILPDNDPWLHATRYGTLSSVAGLPMIFYGQEQGIQNYNPAFPTFDGFDHHELNFGKNIPHFKKWNRLRVWDSPPPNSTGLAEWYGRVNRARLGSHALKGHTQHYLDLRPNGTTANSKIFAIAKFEEDGISPAFQEVVLAFTNLLQHGSAHTEESETFGLTGGVGDPLWNRIGLVNSPNRYYQIRDLAATDQTAHIWPAAKTGQELYQNGISVSLGGGTTNSIADDGELVQYLKIEDITPPPSPQPMTHHFQTGTEVTFTWNPNGGPHDNITHYLVSIGTTHGGSDIADEVSVPFGTNDYTFTGSVGVTYYATIVSVSANGISATTPGSSNPGAPDPGTLNGPVTLLDPNADEDSDGISNAQEERDGTNPFDKNSFFKILSVTLIGNDVAVTFTSVPGRHYRLLSGQDLPASAWSHVETSTAASGDTLTLTHTNGSGDPRRFYQVDSSPNPIP